MAAIFTLSKSLIESLAKQWASMYELISPGHLPNHLTIQKIEVGNSNIRNPILASFAFKGILPYRGLGTGIRRALADWPHISFIDDRDGNQFKVTIFRSNDLEKDKLPLKIERS
jgi:ATP-dependent DNA helicase RecG